ncbi:MAG: hypothetical protein FWG63_04855 [Defluviitaleaceae bacterium]|nr:hypothetical protein [Defluviitaleaceae bacterium]
MRNLDKLDKTTLIIAGWLFYIIGIFLTLIFSSCVSNSEPQNLTQAIVHRIIDGDTIDIVMLDGEIERIRFIGIDAPERGEVGFDEATDFVVQSLPIGSTVYLEAQGNDRDRWGRLRRVVWFTVDGGLVNLNQLLLTEGLVVEMIVN